MRIFLTFEKFLRRVDLCWSITLSVDVNLSYQWKTNYEKLRNMQIIPNCKKSKWWYLTCILENLKPSRELQRAGINKSSVPVEVSNLSQTQFTLDSLWRLTNLNPRNLVCISVSNELMTRTFVDTWHPVQLSVCVMMMNNLQLKARGTKAECGH